MKYFFLPLLFALILLVSCGKSTQKTITDDEKTKSKDIIPRKEMGHVMIDVLLSESAIMNKQVQFGDARYYSIKYYNYLFAKNNITHAQFEQSLDYYTLHSEEMIKIMSEVVDSLSLLQSKVNNQ
jgi:hypothetical protein